LWSLAERNATGSARFLHDGRAATIEEAVLWHGGEAEAARAAYMAMSAGQRKILLHFLSGL
jgi:CxxC motif-containing protein (DUF1111 family)